MQTSIIIQTLIEQTKQSLHQIEQLKSLQPEELIWRADDTSWNILECIEHLNLYANFYLPQIEEKIKSSKYTAESEFKSGFLGNYFAKSMLPNEKMKTMKTFKDKDPIHSKLDNSVIDKFAQHQYKLLDLLNLSKNVSLNKVKIHTSISTLIRIKLGDTFLFYINHITRHMAQIEKIQKKKEQLI